MTQVDSPKTQERLVSLDQFRGYTVAGMFLVNYFGSFAVCPKVWRHSHDYLSYADTIMPHFLFAVGFALRLTFGRRMATQGSFSAYWRMVKRLLGLLLVSFIVYNVGSRAETWEQLTERGLWGCIRDPLKREWVQTLTHIAITSLWILPVIHRSAMVRLFWLIASGLLHVYLSYQFNFTWTNTAPNAIDGGPLGFLTWSIPALMGSLTCDVFLPQNGLSIQRKIMWSLYVGGALMIVGWGLSCGTRFYDVPESLTAELKEIKLADDPVWPTAFRVEAKTASASWSDYLAEPPFVPPPDAVHRKWNYWMMSQRAGTLTYLVFAAGFSIIVYLAFYLVCDVGKLQLPFFRTLGTNALLGYVLHSMVASAVKPFVPKDAPDWYAYGSLFIFFLITWLILRTFEKQGYFLRV